MGIAILRSAIPGQFSNPGISGLGKGPGSRDPGLTYSLLITAVIPGFRDWKKTGVPGFGIMELQSLGYSVRSYRG